MVLDAQVEESNANRLLADYSVEMTAKDVPALTGAARLVPAGTLVTVTFLGNEDTRMRVAAAHAARAAGFVPVPHIAARRLTDRRELEIFLAGMAAEAAVNRVVVVGGDPPEPMGPFPDALAIINSGLLEEYGVQHVSIGGYPEGHPHISEPVLWQTLEDKRAALAERGLGASIITQFGFDADAVLRWIAEARDRGIGLPIRVGVPGPAGVRRLLRYAKRFGAVTSAGIVQKYGFSLTNLVGSAGPDRFVRDLAAGLAVPSAAGASAVPDDISGSAGQGPSAAGASAVPDDISGSAGRGEHGTVRLHFYTFGGLAATATWIRDFREKS
jgi:methylenetetrahydrofolate reductase (NADPH)